MRCGNDWKPRKPHPKKCPQCQNPHWDKPKTRGVRVAVKVAQVEEVDRLKLARDRAHKLLEGIL